MLNGAITCGCPQVLVGVHVYIYIRLLTLDCQIQALEAASCMLLQGEQSSFKNATYCFRPYASSWLELYKTCSILCVGIMNPACMHNHMPHRVVFTIDEDEIERLKIIQSMHCFIVSLPSFLVHARYIIILQYQIIISWNNITHTCTSCGHCAVVT